jgi:hypothetical protein
MGTGKTCTAIAAIEQLRYEKNSHIKRALIFAKGARLIKNFIQELLFTCTDGRYIPDNFKLLTDLEKVRRVRKITSEFYNFFTFEKFAKYLTKLSDEDIINQFSNSIIVIDEVHNIREKMEKQHNKDYDFFKKESFDVYKQFHRMFHLIKYSKILLMSGTVMKDDPSEFSSVMNLILPLNSQFINEKLFINNYFDKDGIFKKSMIEDFQTHIKGRISYLKSMPSEVQKIFIGEKLRNLKHFIVYPDRMSEFQSTHYLKAFEKDKTERSIFINSRQCSLFVFPDGTSGNLGFNQTRYVQKRKINVYDGGIINLIGDNNKKIVKINYTLGRELINELTENNRQNGSLSKLQKFSSKYAKTIKKSL